MVEHDPGRPWLCEFDPDDDSEQVLAEYVAGLDKSSDLQYELDNRGNKYPLLRELAKKELEKG